MYVWQERRNSCPLERSPLNSEGTAGGGPFVSGKEKDGETVAVSGAYFGVGKGDGGFMSRSIRRFNFSWVLSSRVCNSEIACSREAILSASMLDKGGISGVRIP